MNKKGFTLIEMLAAVILLALVMSFATVSYSKSLKKGRENTFKVLTNSLEDAALAAYNDCEANLSVNDLCSNHSLPEVNQTDTLLLSELERYQYIETVKDPYHSSDDCDGNSYVKVKRKSVSVNHNSNQLDTEDIDFEITTCLICGDKRSSGCDE